MPFTAPDGCADADDPLMLNTWRDHEPAASG